MPTHNLSYQKLCWENGNFNGKSCACNIETFLLSIFFFTLSPSAFYLFAVPRLWRWLQLQLSSSETCLSSLMLNAEHLYTNTHYVLPHISWWDSRTPHTWFSDWFPRILWCGSHVGAKTHLSLEGLWHPVALTSLLTFIVLNLLKSIPVTASESFSHSMKLSKQGSC